MDDFNARVWTDDAGTVLVTNGIRESLKVAGLDAGIVPHGKAGPLNAYVYRYPYETEIHVNYRGHIGEVVGARDGRVRPTKPAAPKVVRFDTARGPVYLKRSIIEGLCRAPDDATWVSVKGWPEPYRLYMPVEDAARVMGWE